MWKYQLTAVAAIFTSPTCPPITVSYADLPVVAARNRRFRSERAGRMDKPATSSLADATCYAFEEAKDLGLIY